MQVNFGNGTQSVKLPPLKPVDAETQPVTKPSHGFIDTTREVWKDTLKVKTTAEAYTNGFFRGVRNAAYAGAALVGLDWFATSFKNVGKGKTTIGHVLATPFVLAGKALAKTKKFIFGGNGVENIVARSTKDTIKMVGKGIVDTYKSIMKSPNISCVAKWGLPIVILGTAAYTTFRSYLQANAAAADIDHRYKGDVGHK